MTGRLALLLGTSLIASFFWAQRCAAVESVGGPIVRIAELEIFALSRVSHGCEGFSLVTTGNPDHNVLKRIPTGHNITVCTDSEHLSS